MQLQKTTGEMRRPGEAHFKLELRTEFLFKKISGIIWWTGDEGEDNPETKFVKIK